MPSAAPRLPFSVLVSPAVAGVIRFSPPPLLFVPLLFPTARFPLEGEDSQLIPMARPVFLKKHVIILTGLAMVGQHPINFLLVPKFSFNGAALLFGKLS